MNVGKVGEYIRQQRQGARLSLRSVSGLANVSIPYLSQVERGLRRPSADILQAIAKALRISAETLYVQAGILEDRPIQDVATAIMSDPSITERHKQALIQIYQAFRDEAGRIPEPSPPAEATGALAPGGIHRKAPARSRRAPSATKPRKEVEPEWRPPK